MFQLTHMAGQLILVVLTITTIAQIYRTPESNRALQFSKISEVARKTALWSGVILFVVLMLNNSVTMSLIAMQVGIIFSWFVNLILPSAVYKKYFKSGNQSVNLILFSSNMILNAIFISLISGETYITQVNGISLEIFATVGIMTLTVLVLNVIAHLIVFSFVKVYGFVSGKSFKTNKAFSSDKMADYHDAGLSNEDISYFREQMAPAREMIFELDETMNETAKLRAINLRHKTVITCQDYFRSIVEEPNRIGEAGNFLYKLLPNLTDLVDKYNEINGHVAKNKQTYLILDKSAQMIELIAEEINEDYIHFHKATYNAMDEEIAFAERILNGKNGKNGQHDNVDDIINEDISSNGVDDMMKDLDDFLNNHK